MSAPEMHPLYARVEAAQSLAELAAVRWMILGAFAEHPELPHLICAVHQRIDALRHEEYARGTDARSARSGGAATTRSIA